MGFAFPVFAGGQKTIQLPAPQMDGGMPLMKALKLRCTTREYSSEALGAQELSNLLWAACGINRPEKGKRTAPTAMNKQEIDVYVALAEGSTSTTRRPTRWASSSRRISARRPENSRS